MRKLLFGFGLMLVLLGCDESVRRPEDAYARIYLNDGPSDSFFVDNGHLEFYLDSTFTTFAFQGDADTNDIFFFSMPLENDTFFYCEATGTSGTPTMILGQALIHLSPGDTLIDTIGLY